jgi:antitoxin component of MazEF toxin-antitoxin module
MSTGPTATLKKWCNSIGLVLPAGIAKATRLASGTRVEIDVADGALVIRKAAGQPQLEDLCAGITAANLHTEVDWGSPQGKEAW